MSVPERHWSMSVADQRFETEMDNKRATTPAILVMDQKDDDKDDKPSSSWWNRVKQPVSTTTMETDHSNTAHYTSLSEQQPYNELQEQHHPMRSRKKPGINQALLSQETEQEMQPEDALNSYFYRNIESDSPQKRKRRPVWKAVLRSDNEMYRAFEYNDAVAVLSPETVQRYRVRYEELNQEMPPSDRSHMQEDYDHYHSHDLLLEHNVGSAGGNNSRIRGLSRVVRTDTVEASSLFYQHNGRMLMRLPRDQVQLMMDPGLEPGILSVEQCRPYGDLENNNNVSNRPPLKYVLSVPDNLYRMLIEEMSDAVTKPHCGWKRCCHESEKMDIRVAIAIFGFVLFVLFINTIIWPTD